MQIEFVERKSAVLSPSSLTCLSDTATINLTAGCAHGCIYCYANGYSCRPDNNQIRIYSNLLPNLQNELKRKRKLPKCVYFSPSSDLFQPVPEILAIAYNMLKYLLENNFIVSFLTKGVIPESHFELFQKYPNQVNAQIGLISCNEEVQKIFEPQAAKSSIRVKQISRLIEFGIKTMVRLDPIIPNFTDDKQTFNAICRSVADCGVKHISASMLFLRPAIKETLKRSIADNVIYERIIDSYLDFKRQPIRSSNSSIVPVPLEKRLTVYQRLDSIAKDYGLSLCICGCKNQDVSTTLFNGYCKIVGISKVNNKGLF